MNTSHKNQHFVRVIPNSSRNSISEMEDGRIKVKLTCAPVDGKANKALIAFIAKQWGIAKQDIKIIRGHTSKDKVIQIKKERS